jgi:hypothetical protein
MESYRELIREMLCKAINSISTVVAQQQKIWKINLTANYDHC